MTPTASGRKTRQRCRTLPFKANSRATESRRQVAQQVLRLELGPVLELELRRQSDLELKLRPGPGPGPVLERELKLRPALEP